ncbi:MAG TPA: ribonuclease P protein component [Acholeplasmataceae bacterium]|nr:ribonuclease P protein component [Acholeplasmataceae bacterium]
MNRKYSLKDKRKIEELVRNRQSVGNRYYAIYYQKADVLKIAVSPSRKIKTAVNRNYEKRMAKEILRPLLKGLGNVEMLFVIKPLASELGFAQKKEQIAFLINKIKKEIS